MMQIVLELVIEVVVADREVGTGKGVDGQMEVGHAQKEVIYK